MTVRLLNSALMPAPGYYRLERISESRFAAEVREADRVGNLVSYIGYEQTVTWVRQFTGVDVPMSRQLTVLDDGDVLLIVRLAYRVRPQDKGAIVPEDWEYYRAEYSR